MTLSRDVEKVLSEVLSPGSIPSQQLLLHLPAEPATRVVVRNCEFCPAGCKENDLTKVGTSFSRITYISDHLYSLVMCTKKRCMLVQHHMPHVDNIPKQYLCSLVWRLREALPYTYHDWGWFIQPIIMMILGMVSYWVSRFPGFPHYFFSCFYFIV